MSLKYPSVRRGDFTETLHGVKVDDPYRWLEDVDSEETKKFVEEQNDISRPYLESCVARKYFADQLTEIYDHPKYSCPSKRGSRYLYSYNSGLQNQSVVYKLETLDGEAVEYLNPNTLAEDGTISLSGSSFSKDGESHAYKLSSSGSDWCDIHFKKVATMENYPEVLKKVKFSGMAWTHDNNGIFYGSYGDQGGQTDGSETTGNENQKLMYHKLGTPQAEDLMIMDYPQDPKMMVASVNVSDCGGFLVMHPSKSCKGNMVMVAPLQGPVTGPLSFSTLVDKLDNDYEYITNDGDNFVFLTNHEAKSWQLVKVSLSDPKTWTKLLPEDPQRVLEWVRPIHDNKMICCYLHDVKNELEVRCLSTGALLSSLPLGIGCVTGFSGQREHRECFFTFENKLLTGVVYHLDMTKEPYTPQVYRKTLPRNYDPSLYELKQVWYESKDGTRVPMYLMYRKGIKMDGSNPVFLYAYGGFNISMTPYFSYAQTVFMRCFDGVVAVPSIRGGGEFGDRWHDGGRQLNKQNCFDDFRAAAQYLVKEGYTSKQLLTICGGSNGGLLTAAVSNQFPADIGAAIVQVGVCDMLRFHKFTIGYAWISDYGSPDEEEYFHYLKKYSPYHNVAQPKEGEYPAMLLTTADHDDRVVPLHSFKLVSELQHCLEGQAAPLLISVDTKAGHGGGKPTKKRIEEQTDMFCFIMKALKLEVKGMKGSS